MSPLDNAVARLAQEMREALLRLATDGDTGTLEAAVEGVHEAVSDVTTLAEDPASPPLYAGWADLGATITKEGT